MLQTHWMAQNKSKSNRALMAHVAVYTACLFVFGPFIFPTVSVTSAMTWIALNAGAHFVTDYLTSRWTSQLWKEQRMHEFFTIVGLDQLIHYATLLLSAYYLGMFK